MILAALMLGFVVLISFATTTAKQRAEARERQRPFAVAAWIFIAVSLAALIFG